MAENDADGPGMTGPELKAIRTQLGLSQPKFMGLFGIKSKITISDYENGRAPIPEYVRRLSIVALAAAQIRAVMED